VKLNVEVDLDLDLSAVHDMVLKAAREGLRDVTVLVAADTIEGSPWLTGNNRRSIAYEASGFPFTPLPGSDVGAGENVVDHGKLQGAVYSTSGYGGMLEIDHPTKRGYFKRAADRNFTADNLAKAIKGHLG